MKNILILLILLFTFSCSTTRHNQPKTKSKNNLNNIPVKNKIINAEFYNLNFIIGGVPDVGWNLKLCKNKKYYHTEWSGWTGKSKILDSVNYTIVNNLIHFKSDSTQSDFSSRKYYIYKLKRKTQEYYSDYMPNHKGNYCITHNKIIFPK